MIYGTPPVNTLHKTLRLMTDQDPTCERALEFMEGVIQVRGYWAVRNDPGLQAWIMENKRVLEPRSKRGRHGI